jgi:hypothetical protein
VEDDGSDALPSRTDQLHRILTCLFLWILVSQELLRDNDYVNRRDLIRLVFKDHSKELLEYVSMGIAAYSNHRPTHEAPLDDTRDERDYSPLEHPADDTEHQTDFWSRFYSQQHGHHNGGNGTATAGPIVTPPTKDAIGAAEKKTNENASASTLLYSLYL